MGSAGGHRYQYSWITALAVAACGALFYALFAAGINPDLIALALVWLVLLVSLRDHRYLFAGWFLVAPYFPFGVSGRLNFALNISHYLLVPLVAVVSLSASFLKGKRVTWGKEDSLFVVFLVYAVFSAYYTAGGRYLDLKAIYAIYLLPFLLYITTKHLTIDRHLLRVLAYVSVFHLATLAVTGYLEYRTGVSLYTGRLRWDDVGMGRIAGPFGSPIILGLSVTFLSILLFAGYRLGVVSRLVFTASMTVAAGLCILTFTRSVWLGVLACWIYVILKEGGSTVARTFALVGVALVVTAIGALVMADPEVAERALNPQTGLHRIGLVYGSLKLIADYPLFGAGFGTFDALLPKYLPNYLLGAPIGIATSHVTLLTLVAELGAAGIVWLIAFVVVVLAQSRHQGKAPSSEQRLVITANYGFILAFVVNACLIDMRFFSLAYCWAFISLGIIRNFRKAEVSLLA